MAEQAQEARGVHNPRVVDLIHLDEATGEVVLLMLEERPWGSDPEQLRQLEAKFNAYLEYVLGGHMVKQYRTTPTSRCACSSTASRTRRRPTPPSSPP